MEDERFVPLTIIIPTMNRPDALIRTLNGYASVEPLPSKVIVVDQSQEEATRQSILAMTLSFSDQTECIYLYQQEASLTKARNRAMMESTDEIVVFSDDDVDVFGDTLANVHTLMQDQTIAMIAGWNANCPRSTSKIGYLLGTKSFIHRKIGHVTRSMLGRYPETIHGEVATQWAMGYFFAIRRSLFDRWHMQWDENLTGYAYAEDLDFSYRYCKKAKLENLRCILSDQVVVRHLASQEYRTPSRKSTFMYVLNRAYLRHKWKRGFQSQVAMAWCNFWRAVERVVRKDAPKDMIDAVKAAFINREAIKNGNLRDLYQQAETMLLKTRLYLRWWYLQSRGKPAIAIRNKYD